MYGSVVKLDSKANEPILGNIFERRSGHDTATVQDIKSLIDLLASHYSLMLARLDYRDLSVDDMDTLADIFGLMSQYYLLDPGNLLSEQRQLDLMFIYERISTIYYEFAASMTKREETGGVNLPIESIEGVDQAELEEIEKEFDEILDEIDEVIKSDEFEEEIGELEHEFEDNLSNWTDLLHHGIEQSEEIAKKVQEEQRAADEEREAEEEA